MLQKKISILINYINLISCIYLAAASICYTSVQQIGFYFFFISFFLEIFLDRKWQNIKLDKVRIYFLIMLLFFLLIFIYHPFENSNKYFLRFVELRLALFGYAVVGFFGVNKLYKLEYIANAFVVSSVIVILILVFGAVGIKEFIVNPERAALFNHLRIIHINSHLVFNVYLNISLVFCWYYLFKVKSLKYKKVKFPFYIIAAILIIYILLISEGRMGLLTCMSMLLLIIGVNLWRLRKLYVYILILFAPFVVWILISSHKRLTPLELKNDPHAPIWNAAIDVAKNQPFIGYGASRAQEEFDVSFDKFLPKEYKVGWKENKILHCQNQFLQTYMEFGIIGIFLLIYLITAPLVLAENGRRFLSFLLMFIIAAQFNTEIVLTFQGYPVIFGLLTLIMIVLKEEQPTSL